MKIRRTEFEKLLSPAELESDAVCLWVTTPPYIIVDGTILPQSQERPSVVAPLANPDLFLSFARLESKGEPSETSIRGWVNRHGLLKGRDRGRGPSSEDRGTYIKPEERIVQYPLKVSEFRREVRCANQLLWLYTNVRERDYGTIAEWFLRPPTWQGEPTVVERYLERWRTTYYDGDKWMLDQGIATRHRLGERRIGTAETILLDSLVDAVAGVRLSLTELPMPGEQNPARLLEMRRTLRCPDLLSAIYLQLYLMVTQSRSMRRCEACGMPFPAKPKSKRHCNSTCRSNARHRRNREEEEQ